MLCSDLQSKEFDLIVHQIQFIFGVRDILVVNRDEYAQCKLCRRLEIPRHWCSSGQVQFLEDVDMPVGVQTTGLWFRQVQKTVLVPQVQFNRRGVEPL